MVPARPPPVGWHPGAPPQRQVAKGSWGVRGPGLRGQREQVQARDMGASASSNRAGGQGAGLFVWPPYPSKKTIHTKSRARLVSPVPETGPCVAAFSVLLLFPCLFEMVCPPSPSMSFSPFSLTPLLLLLVTGRVGGCRLPPLGTQQ